MLTFIAALALSVPSAPTVAPTVVKNNGAATISFAAVSGATKYTVYRDTTTGGTFATAVCTDVTYGTQCVATGLTNSTSYYFKYTAGDGTGYNATKSPVSLVAAPLATIPTSPTGTLAITQPVASGTSLVLTWAAAGGSPTGYKLYWSTTAGGTGTAITLTNVLTYTHTGLTAGTKYYYRLSATNANGESVRFPALWTGTTNVLETTGAPLAAPTAVASASLDPPLSLTFTAPAGSPTSYKIKRAPYTTSCGTYATIGSPTASPYSDTTALAGTAYCYKVSALKSGMTAANESADSTVLSNKLLRPAKPATLSATPGNAQVALSWSASTGATSYSVKRGAAATGPFSAIAAACTGIAATNCTDATAVNGTTYYYMVNATNAAGTSLDWTSGGVGTTLAPASPTGLTVTASNTQTAFSWSASTGAASYSIKRGLSASGPFSPITTSCTGVTATTCVDVTTAIGAPYYYMVNATNATGTSPDWTSNAIPARPVSPTSLMATGLNASVSLNWNSSPTAATYSVKRGSSPNGPFTAIAAACTNVSSNLCTDSTVTNGTTYYYMVNATNASGTSADWTYGGVVASPAATPLTPTGLATTGAIQQVLLSWNASANATSYTVKRGSVASGPFTSIICTTSQTSCVDLSAVNGTLYFYMVSASNPAGTSADWSSGGVAGTAVLPIPAAPASLAAIPGDNQVTLSWAASDTATSYGVKRGSAASGPFSSIGAACSGITQTTCVDTTALNDTTYYYMVNATNTSGTSLDWTTAGVMATPLGALTPDKGVYAVGETIALSWNDSGYAAGDWLSLTNPGAPATSRAAELGPVSAGQKAISFTTGLLVPGSYVARYLSSSGVIKRQSAIFVVGAAAPASLVASKTTYSTNEAVAISFANVPSTSDTWLAIRSTTSNYGTNYHQLKYLGMRSEAAKYFTSVLPGTYTARLYQYNSSTLAAESAPFTVSGSPGVATLSTDSTAYAAGAPTKVTFSGVPFGWIDYVVIVAPGSPDSGTCAAYTASQYLSATQNNTPDNLSFALPNGTYVARYYRDNGCAGSMIAESATFTVGLPPVATTTLAAVGGNNQVMLSWSGGTNLALGKVATQSSCNTGCWGGIPSKANDGSTDGNFYNGSVIHTDYASGSWWQVDLGAAYQIDRIEVWNRTDGGGGEPARTANFRVKSSLTGAAGTWTAVTQIGQCDTPSIFEWSSIGRYVMVELIGTNYLNLAEVRVIGSTTEPKTYTLKKSWYSGGPYFTVSSGLPSTNYVDGFGNIFNGQTAYYVLTTTTAAGVSSDSAQVSATATPTYDNGAGGTFAYAGSDNYGMAKAACESYYGVGQCSPGASSAGQFSYWYKTSDGFHFCGKREGSYEWIYYNNGQSTIGADYGGGAYTNVTGVHRIVRRRATGSATCSTPNEWAVTLLDYGRVMARPALKPRSFAAAAGADSITLSWNPDGGGKYYQGCFTDQAARSLPNYLGTNHSVESCVATAFKAGYAYAGLQAGGECWAGNLNRGAKVADAQCTTACNAAPGQICGGALRNSVYFTGLTNLAAGLPAANYTQIDNPFTNSNATKCGDGKNDGWYTGGFVCHTGIYSNLGGATNQQNGNGAWWQVDLGGVRDIRRIEVWNRQSDEWGNTGALRTTNFNVKTSLTGQSGSWTVVNFPGTAGSPTAFDWSTRGRFVRVELAGTNYLNLNEVRVLGVVGDQEMLADESVPPSASTSGWLWDSTIVSAGTYSHTDAAAPGVHQHLFEQVAPVATVGENDTLIAWVYLDPANPPSELMLQWSDSVTQMWDHRAYWGTNSIAWGVNGTESLRYMGPLPPVGVWVPLQVPASAVGMAGQNLRGIAFTLFNGKAYWDRAGIWHDSKMPETYNITRSGGASSTTLYSGNRNTFTDRGLSQGTSYTYTIYATNAGGGVAGSSVSATPAATIFNNGAGGFATAPDNGASVMALAACESTYGSGQCSFSSCGSFYYAYQTSASHCSCTKAPGSYEWIYSNTGYTSVGQDYGGQAAGVIGLSTFVRQKVSATCDSNSWMLVSANYATPAAAAPPTPTGFSASTSGSDPAISLSWNLASGATLYTIKRSTQKNGPYTAIAGTKDKTFVDTSAASYSTYWYTISASNAAGVSLDSAPIAKTSPGIFPAETAVTSSPRSILLKAPTVSVQGGYLAFHALEVDPNNMPTGYEPDTSDPDGARMVTSLQVDIYTGEFIEGVPGQLDATLMSLSTSENSMARELGLAIGAMRLLPPRSRAPLIIGHLQKQGSLFVADLVAALDPNIGAPLSVPLDLLAPAWAGMEITRNASLNFFPPFPGTKQPSFSELDLTHPVLRPNLGFERYTDLPNLIADPCFMGATTGIASPVTSVSRAGFFPPTATTVTVNYTQRFTGSMALSWWRLSEAKQSSTYGIFPYFGVGSALTTLIATKPGVGYTLCIESRTLDVAKKTFTPTDAYLTTIAPSALAVPPTPTLSAVSSEVSAFNPSTETGGVGSPYTRPIATLTFSKDPVLDIAPFYSGAKIFRDDVLLGSVAANGTVTAGSTLQVCAGSANSWCITDDLRGEHPRVTTYRMEKIYSSAYITADVVSSPSVNLNIPFAWGIVDAHTHMFNHESFGAWRPASLHNVDVFPFEWTARTGYSWLHGTVAGTEAQALSSCGATHGHWYNKTKPFDPWSTVPLESASPNPVRNDVLQAQNRTGFFQDLNTSNSTCTFGTNMCDNSSPRLSCGSPLAKGCWTRADSFQRNMAIETSEHMVDGFPEFTQWPNAKLWTHQQMWNGWLKRAHKYGLRMATMLAETNREICASRLLAGPDAQVPGQAKTDAAYYCDEGENINRSLDAAVAFESAPDATNPGRPNSDWFKVVYTPREARLAMAEGKLAVVLGIEFEELLGKDCMDNPNATCPYNTRAAVEDRVKYWYDRGVRHVFPVHLADNAITGTSFYNVFFTGLAQKMNGVWPGRALNQGTTDTSAQRPREAYTSANRNLSVSGGWDCLAPTNQLTDDQKAQRNAACDGGFQPTNNCGVSAAAFFDEWGNAITPADPDATIRNYKLPSGTLKDYSLNFQYTYWQAINWVVSGLLAATDTTPRTIYFGTRAPGANQALSTSVIFANGNNANGNCNGMGLTRIGRWFVDGLMARGMIIDVDHFSATARRQIYSVAKNKGYPLAAGHAVFHDTIQHYSEDTERALDVYDLKNLLANRGMVAPRVNQHQSVVTNLLPNVPGSDLPECTPGGLTGPTGNIDQPQYPEFDIGTPSSRSFAHAYAYYRLRSAALFAPAGPLFGKDSYFNSAGGGVALGTDMNGFIDMPAARKTGYRKDQNCGGPAFSYVGATAKTPTGGVVQISPWESSGTKSNGLKATVDYGERGLATIGQLPEFVADLKNVGLTDPQIDPVYRGAESYLRMWEQAEWAGKPIISDGLWRVKVVPYGSVGSRLSNARSEDTSTWSAAVSTTNAYPPPSVDVFTGLAGAAPTTNDSLYMASSTMCLSSCPMNDYVFRKTFDINGAWETDVAKMLRVRAAAIGPSSNFDSVRVYIDDLLVGTLFEVSGNIVAGTAADVTRATQLYLNGASARSEGRHVLTVVLSHGAPGAAAVRVDLR